MAPGRFFGNEQSGVCFVFLFLAHSFATEVQTNNIVPFSAMRWHH